MPLLTSVLEHQAVRTALWQKPQKHSRTIWVTLSIRALLVHYTRCLELHRFPEIFSSRNYFVVSVVTETGILYFSRRLCQRLKWLSSPVNYIHVNEQISVTMFPDVKLLAERILQYLFLSEYEYDFSIFAWFYFCTDTSRAGSWDTPDVVSPLSREKIFFTLCEQSQFVGAQLSLEQIPT